MSFPKKKVLRSIIIGMVLGDASLSKITSKQNSRLCIGHSIKQKNYCKFKFEVIKKALQLEYNLKKYEVFNKKSNKTYITYQGSTKVHRYLTKIRKLMYVNNKKIVSEKMLDYLEEKGLAFWFMDDGGKRPNHKRKFINGLFLSTQSFSYEENLIIKNWFLKKHDIKTSIVKHGHGKFRLNFNKENSYKLKKIIEPHVLPEFKYKLILEYSDISENPS